MEDEVNDNEAGDADNVSLVTLDLLGDGGKRSLHKFELSNVRLVHRKTDVEDNEEEIYYLSEPLAEESFVQPRIVESNNSNNELDNSSGRIEDDNVEEFFGEERRTSKISTKGNSGVLVTLKEEQEDKNDQNENEDENTIFGVTDRFPRASRKFTIASDIEEVDEEMEEYEISTSEELQPQDAKEEISGFRDEVYKIDTRLSLARSRKFDRAASILEQRLKTISSLKELYEERKKIALKNRFLNKKCYEYLKKTTTVDFFESTEGALPIHENHRYLAVLEEYIDTKTDYENRRPSVERDIESLADSYHTYRTNLEQIFEDLKLRELEIGLQCVNGKTGKSLGEHRVKSFIKKQPARFNNLAAIRVNYLRLTHLLADVHSQIREMDRIGEGRTLIDYEQLLIEKNSHVDKLDEREAELQKLRDKCAESVSILSHLKETSDVFVYDIINDSAILAEIIEEKNEARTSLAIERKKVEALRKTTSRIRQTHGLLNDPSMLRKMETDLIALDVLKLKMQKSMDNGQSFVGHGNVISGKEDKPL